MKKYFKKTIDNLLKRVYNDYKITQLSEKGGAHMLYPNLEGELRKRKITRNTISKDLNLNISTVSRKLTEVGKLKYQEAVDIKNLYFPELMIEYLFATDIQ